MPSNYDNLTYSEPIRLYFGIDQRDIAAGGYEIVADYAVEWSGNYVSSDSLPVKVRNTANGTELDADDYTVKYLDASDENEKALWPGKATIRVEGNGRYKGTLTKDFSIYADLRKEYVTVKSNKKTVDFGADLPAQFYTGNAFKPEDLVLELSLTTTIDGEDVQKVIEYPAYYGVDINEAGNQKYEVTIYGKSPFYQKERKLKFTANTDLTDATAVPLNSIEIGEGDDKQYTYQYTGSAIKPEFSVNTKSGARVNCTSVVATYYKVGGPGTAVSPRDIGDYYAELSVTLAGKTQKVTSKKFTIVKRNLGYNDDGRLRFSYTPQPIYEKKACEPPVMVYFNGTKLDEVNYTVEYENNTFPTKEAKIKIKAKESSEYFAGDVTKTFEIRLDPVSDGDLKAKVIAGESAVNLTWSMHWNRVDGYLIEQIDKKDISGKSLEPDKEPMYFREAEVPEYVKNGSLQIGGLQGGCTYTYRVRPFLGNNDDITLGDGATVTTGKIEAVTPAIEVKAEAKGSVSMDWSNLNMKDYGVNVVEVWRYVEGRKDETNGCVGVFPVGVEKYNYNNLTSGRTYIYYVVGYYYSNGVATPAVTSNEYKVKIQ